MAKIGAIDTIKESYEFIKENYKGMLVPIIALLLIQIVYSGSYFFLNAALRAAILPSEAGAFSPAANASLVANAMTDSLGALWGLGMVALAAVLVVAILLGLLMSGLQYYIYDGFYCIMRKKQPQGSWQSRLVRLTLRWLALGIVLGLFLGVPLAVSFAGMLYMGVLGLAILAIVVPIVLVLWFLLSQSWIYYLLEERGLSESLSGSWKLVSSNAAHYIKLYLVFMAIVFAATLATVLTCCLSLFISPVVQVFLALLMHVALMKSRLALDKSKQAS